MDDDKDALIERLRGYIVALAREHCGWQKGASDLEILNWTYEWITEDSAYGERTPEEEQMMDDLGLTRNWRKT